MSDWIFVKQQFLDLWITRKLRNAAYLVCTQVKLLKVEKGETDVLHACVCY